MSGPRSPVLHRNHSVFHSNHPVDVWILVGGACGRAVHDGEASRTRGNRLYVQEKPSETCVNALNGIGIVPYWPDHGLRGRADVMYTWENEWYSRDHEPYGPDYDLRTLDDVV